MKNLISNTATIAYRNLLKTLHNPDKLLDVIVQPVLFMLMFGYLFGGAIAGNVHTGIYNRFKSLPISNLAPLAGQLVADILRLVVAAIASLATGYLMGWRSSCRFGLGSHRRLVRRFSWLGNQLDLCFLRSHR